MTLLGAFQTQVNDQEMDPEMLRQQRSKLL